MDLITAVQNLLAEYLKLEKETEELRDRVVVLRQQVADSEAILKDINTKAGIKPALTKAGQPRKRPGPPKGSKKAAKKVAKKTTGDESPKRGRAPLPRTKTGEIDWRTKEGRAHKAKLMAAGKWPPAEKKAAKKTSKKAAKKAAKKVAKKVAKKTSKKVAKKAGSETTARSRGQPTFREAVVIAMEGVETFRARDVYNALEAKGWLPNTSQNDPVAYLSFRLGNITDTFERVKHGVYRVRKAGEAQAETKQASEPEAPEPKAETSPAPEKAKGSSKGNGKTPDKPAESEKSQDSLELSPEEREKIDRTMIDLKIDEDKIFENPFGDV